MLRTSVDADLTLDLQVNIYYLVLRDFVDAHAPGKICTFTITPQLTWFNGDLTEAKHIRQQYKDAGWHQA